MEKNLPFVTIPVIENNYNKFIIPFIKKLDDGNVFKTIITVILSTIAFAILVGGSLLTFLNIFGDDGYINSSVTREGLTGLQAFGSVMGLIFGFAISILASWVMYSIFKKRTEQLKSLDFRGLLDYLFNKTIPSVIIMVGEIMFTLLLYTGLLQIIATLFGSYAYAPLQKFPAVLLDELPGMNILRGLAPYQVMGSYENFGEYLKIGIIGIVLAFGVLIMFYLYKELYNYVLKLITNLIMFLPKFGIPIAIRRRDESNIASRVVSTIDKSDL